MPLTLAGPGGSADTATFLPPHGALGFRAISLPWSIAAGASFETLNQPASRGARRSFLAIDRVHRHELVRGARHLDPDGAQPVARDVIFHHEHGHVTEAEAGAQKGVLRAHVGEPPNVLRIDPIGLALRKL